MVISLGNYVLFKSILACCVMLEINLKLVRLCFRNDLFYSKMVLVFGPLVLHMQQSPLVRSPGLFARFTRLKANVTNHGRRLLRL